MKLKEISEGEMKVAMKEEMISIKENIAKTIGRVKNGKIELQLMHEVGAIVPLGWESGLKEDMLTFLKDVLPEGRYKKHDEPKTPFRYNFYQHGRAKLVGSPFFLVQIKDGKPVLGKYQDILLYNPVFKEMPNFTVFYRLYEFE